MDSDVTNLAEHAAIVRRRWRILLAALIIGVAVGGLVSANQPTKYTAVARLLLEPTHETSGSQIMSPEEVATQADVVSSSAVARLVIESQGLDTTTKDLLQGLTVQAIDQTRVVEVAAIRPDAAEAASVANGFAEAYIQLGLDNASKAALNTSNAYSDELNRVQDALREVRATLGKTDDAAERGSLRAQLRSLTTRQAELNTEIAVTGTIDPTQPGLLLLDAEPPATPSQPRLMRNLALGGFLGLVLGLVAAYGRDRLDDRIRDEARLRLALGGLPIVGRIPFDTRDDRTRPAALTATRSPVSEAYRALNTNIRFLADARPTSSNRKTKGTLLLVTSAVPEEGKTTVSCNLAVAAARVGLKVLLVDGDLRHPRVSEKFGLETPRGLAHLLAGQATLDEVCVDTGVENLTLIGAGAIPPNPAELLASHRAREVWRTLHGKADLIIVDAAPVLRVADPLEIAPHADDVLLATRHHLSRVHQLEAAIERIRQIGGDLSGVVFSAIPGKTDSYNYGPEPEEPEEPEDPKEPGSKEPEAPKESPARKETPAPKVFRAPKGSPAPRKSAPAE